MYKTCWIFGKERCQQNRTAKVLKYMQSLNPITLLPTCWMFNNTGFHAGLRSFFKTSVLQIGIGIPPSTIFDITRKGSCKNQQYATNIPHGIQTQEKKGKEILAGSYTSWEQIPRFQIWTPQYQLSRSLWADSFFSIDSECTKISGMVWSSIFIFTYKI